MFVRQLGYVRMAGTPDVRPSVHIPTVYESVATEPSHWEYHVLTIDAREQALPDSSQLNTLGQEGWILVSILDESVNGRGSKVHYYFVRKANT
ncbi:MAG: hypothetical protein E6J34_02285 [Chloroflexi bacterium]|nr:MAG: hypothetical protein E6J34_02285 [Chloroflexota bacterium]